MKHTFLFLLLILLLGLTACSKPADRTLVYSVVKTYQDLYNLKSATPFPKCYLHKEKWTFDS